jgi:hypothetical protein
MASAGCLGVRDTQRFQAGAPAATFPGWPCNPCYQSDPKGPATDSFRSFGHQFSDAVIAVHDRREKSASALECTLGTGVPPSEGLPAPVQPDPQSIYPHRLNFAFVTLYWTDPYNTGPMRHGTNSWWPRRSAQVFSPEATRNSIAKISRPTSWTLFSPSAMAPALMSMLSCMRR